MMLVYIHDQSGEISAASIDESGNVLEASISLAHDEVTAANLAVIEILPERADWYNINSRRWRVMDESEFATCL